jgi:hypothetical protein
VPSWVEHLLVMRLGQRFEAARRSPSHSSAAIKKEAMEAGPLHTLLDGCQGSKTRTRHGEIPCIVAMIRGTKGGGKRGWVREQKRQLGEAAD